jgi:uncharacterized protein YbaA (DUF1428 family)
MSYVEGFLIPVPSGNREAYLKLAKDTAPVFLENGALRVVECWGDDLPHGHTTDFFLAVKAEDGENVVFSWIIWPSKAVRDEGSAKVMADPRMQPGQGPSVFDGKRMIFGGFELLMDTGA